MVVGIRPVEGREGQQRVVGRNSEVDRALFDALLQRDGDVKRPEHLVLDHFGMKSEWLAETHRTRARSAVGVLGLQAGDRVPDVGRLAQAALQRGVVQLRCGALLHFDELEAVARELGLLLARRSRLHAGGSGGSIDTLGLLGTIRVEDMVLRDGRRRGGGLGDLSSSQALGVAEAVGTALASYALKREREWRGHWNRRTEGK